MRVLILLFATLIVFVNSCAQQAEPKVNVREGVASDTLTSNIVTRPVTHAFSALIGEGIVVNSATLKKNESGMLEVQVNGFNQSYNTKKFRYRVEWLDENGGLIETKTSVWLPMSAMGKQPFSFKVVAPRPEAVDFRIDTRKWED